MFSKNCSDTWEYQTGDTSALQEELKDLEESFDRPNDALERCK